MISFPMKRMIIPPRFNNTRKLLLSLNNSSNDKNNRLLNLQSRNRSSKPSLSSSSSSTTKNATSTAKYWGLLAAGSVVVVSVFTRQYRETKLQELDWNGPLPTDYNVEDILEILERNGLMGVMDSVKDELDYIQAWHTEHGYRGGLTVRDLTQHLYVDKASGRVEQVEELVKDPLHLARRECYYMYYEITGNGHIRQQIFCRGTTLAAEIMTCLSCWMVYDQDLDCRIHSGIRDHADRILKDILPLLPPAEDRRTTVEVSGHSLGGAVAFILAAKLRKRGFNVVRAISVAAPRFCASESGAQTVQALLPKSSLRIENDTDIITYLPPFGQNVGDKLYVLDSFRNVAFVPKNDTTKWSDSVFVNFRLHELLRAGAVPHRVYTYIARLEEAFGKWKIVANQEETNQLDLSSSEAVE